jgi:class 3 adenylate cyclase
VLALSTPDGTAPGVDAVIAEHRGILIARTRDSLLARFDGPGRAVNCAVRLVRAAPGGGRAGVHTGEITLDGDQVRGLAIEIARETAGHAAAGGVLVTRTVTDLVAGSPLRFTPFGRIHLATVGGEWTLFRPI